MKKTLSTLFYELEKGHDCMLVSIVADAGSAPRRSGSMMLVTAAGRLVGTIGGGAVEFRSEQKALELLEKKQTLVHTFALRATAGENIGMVCGGDVTVLFSYVGAGDTAWYSAAAAVSERLDRQKSGFVGFFSSGIAPVLTDGAGTYLAGSLTEETPVLTVPLPLGERAILFGGGHISASLAPLLKSVGFRVTVMDCREEYANRDRFPSAEEVIVGDYTRLGDYITIEPDDYIVVMTNGHEFDYEVELQAIKRRHAYLGVIGSRQKTRAINEKLRAAGIPDDRIETVYTPIGMSIRAVTPEELAVSIAAEMILVRAQRRDEAGETAPVTCPMH